MDNSPSYNAYKKSPYKSKKHTPYFDTYDRLFSNYRNKEIIFVEIGVLSGGSLFMWRDFFGPKARIIGIDLNPNAKKWEKEGFEIFIGSQSDPSFWKTFIDDIGTVDIVLDDGGHQYVQQIITCESLLENINDGGMLVVEDVHTSYMSGYGDKNISFTKYVKTWIDRINSRNSIFRGKYKDCRVWSIEIFESIVAFKINRRSSELKSKAINNGGISDEATDFGSKDSDQINKNIKEIKSKIEKSFTIF